MTETLTPSQSQRYFNRVINLPVWEVAYVSGSVFFFKIGKVIHRTILSGNLETEKPYRDGEYVVYLDGNWQFLEKGKQPVTGKQSAAETDRAYYDKMYHLEKRLNEAALQITGIAISSERARIEFNTGWLFSLQAGGAGLISLSDFKGNLIHFDSTVRCFLKEKCRG